MPLPFPLFLVQLFLLLLVPSQAGELALVARSGPCLLEAASRLEEVARVSYRWASWRPSFPPSAPFMELPLVLVPGLELALARVACSAARVLEDWRREVPL